MAIVWRDAMAIDNDIIDADHKCLIDLLNQVDTLPVGAKMEAILAQLDAYARAHFGREEQLQIAAHFTYSRAHHLRHQGLMRALDAMRAENRGEPDRDQLRTFHARMCAFLHDWLLDHILHADILMKPFVAEMALHAKDAASLVEIVRLSETQKVRDRGQSHREMLLPCGAAPRWR